MGAIVNVATCLASPLRGFRAALATVLTEASVLSFQCWTVRKDLPLGEYAISAIPFLILVSIMTALLRLAVVFLEPILGLGWVLLFVEILLAVLMYGVLVLGWACKRGKLDFVLSLLMRN